MTRDDITRMAREAGFVGFDGDNGSLRRFAALVAAAERNKLAQWIIQRGYATGHGDTMEDLLKELEWQVRESERKAFAQIAKDWDEKHPDTNYGACIAEATKARNNT